MEFGNCPADPSHSKLVFAAKQKVYILPELCWLTTKREPAIPHCGRERAAGDTEPVAKGSLLSARVCKTQTSPSDNLEISILIRWKSGFGQTSSFLPWKLICPGVRRHPRWLVTKGLGVDCCGSVRPTKWICNLSLWFLWKWLNLKCTWELLWKLQVVCECDKSDV